LSGVIITMLFDSLYDYDHDLKLVPSIAAALPEISEDGRTFTIPIRRGVRFHNGRALNAEDVVWSLERMLQPDLHSPGAPYYRAIEGFADFQAKRTPHLRGLRALDEHTVRIALERPDQSFVYTLAMRFAAPVPREEVERGRDMRRRPIGTGPFRLVSWDPGVRLVLERHRQYRVPGRPYLERVVFEEAVKRDTAFMRFRNGEGDLAPRMTPADAMLVKSAPWRAYSALSPQADVYALFMNVGLAPFDNVHVRRAVAAAIDRERWSRARNGFIRPAGQIVPPKVAGYDPKLPHLQHFDLAKAREEMRLAGFPHGLPDPVTLWVSDSPTGRIYGELAQADLAKIGVELLLKPVSFPVYLEETGKPKTAQMLVGGWVLDFPDASNVLNLVSSASLAQQESMNRSFFADPGLDALLERALVERDPQRRAAMYREANDFVADQAPWAILCNQQVPQAWQPYVRGYAPHPIHWIKVNDVWLDLPRKRVATLLRGAATARLAALLPLGFVGAMP
ncbi:MAG TPA: ABC transporter substrate-binding protein, partial [Polyangiaceae bacterium]|nr:ABC transporter substrate-binding protein [Polyangiaceae bacterium]